MAIQYALFENNLTSDPGDYCALVQITSSADLRDVADQMVNQGSTVTKTDILAVLEDALKAVESMLLDGKRVNFGGLVDLFPSVKGIFNGPMDGYDKSRHQVDVRARAGSRVRNTVRKNGSVVKVESVKPMPSPIEYYDLASGERNGALTPGSIGTIYGHRLKFSAENTDEGIFLISTVDNSETKIDIVQKNKPAELVFLVPATLAAGEYTFEIRARIASSEDLRRGALQETVTVS